MDGAGPDTLVWETYRTTLANRLAEKRYKRLSDGGAVKPADKKAESEIRQILVDQVKGEIKMWEDVLPVAENLSADDVTRIARLAAAVFGGASNESDYEVFMPLFQALFTDAARSMPILAGKMAQAT